MGVNQQLLGMIKIPPYLARIGKYLSLIIIIINYHHHKILTPPRKYFPLLFINDIICY